MILDKNDWPKWLQHPSVIGVSCGPCIETGKRFATNKIAHAHISGDMKGWICFRTSKKRLRLKDTCLHELAHVIAECGHTDKWRKTLRELGGHITGRYKKKRRVKIKYEQRNRALLYQSMGQI